MKLRDLSGNMELADQFHDAYCRALAEAIVAKDRERIKALRKILHQQVRFVMGEMISAKREECGREEIVQ